MRLTTRRTLFAIAISIATATGATAAVGGQGGPRDAGAGCPDKHLARIAERLNLTPEQQAQVKTIIEEERAAADRLRADTRKRIEGVLTDAQRAEQAARMQKRIAQQVDRLAKRLTLTPDQTPKVRAILEERRLNPALDRAAVQERIAAVLTPEQRQQFESTGPGRAPRGKGDCGPGGKGPQGRPAEGPGGGPADADGPEDGPDEDGPNQR